MTWFYLLAAIALFAAPLASPLAASTGMGPLI